MMEPVARLRIALQEIEPTIWRRVDVPLSSTLLVLHDSDERRVRMCFEMAAARRRGPLMSDRREGRRL